MSNEYLEIFDGVPEHSRLAPSSSGRWVHCHGSAKLNLPDTGSAAAELGTLAHSFGYHALLDEPLPAEDSDKLAELSDEDFKEMTAGVQLYIDFVRGIPGLKHFELKLQHPTIADFGGTLDAIGITDDFLHIADLKYGLMFVGASRNRQLLSYLCLARHRFGRRPIYYATIVQPRVADGRTDTETFTNEDLDDHELDVIEAAYDDTLTPGGWCHYCPLLMQCKVAEQHRHDMAAIEFADDALPAEITLDKCVEIVNFAPVIQRMAELAKDRMLGAMQRGVRVPGWKVGENMSNRQWKDEANLIATLELNNFDPKVAYHEPKLKSPAQLEKELPKSLLEDLTTRRRTGLSVVPITSKLREVDFDSFDSIPDEQAEGVF